MGSDSYVIVRARSLLADWQALKDANEPKGQVEIARVIRNECVSDAGLKSALTEIASAEKLLGIVSSQLSSELESGKEEELLATRCSLQVVHNMCVQNPVFVAHVRRHNTVLPRVVVKLKSTNDAKTRNFAASVVLQMLSVDGDSDGDDSWLDAGLLAALAAWAPDDQAEFCLFCLRRLCERRAPLVADLYRQLDVQVRTVLLDLLLLEQQKPAAGSPLRPPPLELVQLAAARFKEQATLILTTLKTPRDRLDPTEVTRLLGLLSELTATESNDVTATSVRDDKSVLIDAVYLLRMIHDLGKVDDSANVFAPVRKVAEAEKEDQEANPAYGFKRDLIRLVGNMCWQHKENQDQVRELEGVQLILDCSPIDFKNPLILQWVIFAVGNLCRDNPENQAIIRNLDKKGEVNKNVMDGFGIHIK